MTTTYKKIRAIITGATGMVGEGVLHECLQHPQVEAVLVINRKPCGVTHPKLKEVLHKDFFNLSAIEDQLQGYNACYFCLGISSVGVSKEDYYKTTYTLTMHVAGTLVRLNPDMTFCYVSGAGTNETGRLHWAQVKGKTENDLMKLPFAKVFPFRPGFMKPTKGQKNALSFYKYINWFFPIGNALFSNSFCTLRQGGLAMIQAVNIPDNRKIINVKDIKELAKEV